MQLPLLYLLEVEVANPVLSVVAVASCVVAVVPSVQVRATAALPTAITGLLPSCVTVTVAVHLQPLPVLAGFEIVAETAIARGREGLQDKRQA